MQTKNIEESSRKLRERAGFTLIELMVALAILGILSMFAAEVMLQNQKGARMNEFDNAVNAAMAELTRLASDPLTCSSTFHGLGPGNSDYAQEANKFTNWTRVPYFIYDSGLPETGSNLIARNFPTIVTLSNGNVISDGPPPPFRGSKILGIRSVYIAPHNYPNYPIQENLSPGFKGNAFVEITFEYIGPPNSMIGLKTRTRMLPLAVTWAKKISISASSGSPTNMDQACTKLALDESCNPACVGQIIETCAEDDNLGIVLCNCAIFQPGRQNWQIRECNAVNGT